MHKEIKLSFSASCYVKFKIHKHLRTYLTKLRLSSHKYLVESGMWIKPKVPYNKRRCTLCNNPNIQDEFYITLLVYCVSFVSLRKKYTRQYCYRELSCYCRTIKIL